MSRLFVESSLQYLQVSSGTNTTAMTVSLWFYLTDISDNSSLFWTGVALQANRFTHLFYRGNAGSDPLSFFEILDGTSGLADTSSSPSVNTWHHACGVRASSSDRRVYLDAAGEGTNSTTVTLAAADRMAIGRAADSSPQDYADARVADVAVWNVALDTATEVPMLAAGYSPLFIRPQSLVHYWPLIGQVAPEQDRISRANMTVQNGPTAAPHPRIIMPSGIQLASPAAAAAAVNLYRRRLIMATAG